jgi:hypothetical protein
MNSASIEGPSRRRLGGGDVVAVRFTSTPMNRGGRPWARTPAPHPRQMLGAERGHGMLVFGVVRQVHALVRRVPVVLHGADASAGGLGEGRRTRAPEQGAQ